MFVQDVMTQHPITVTADAHIKGVVILLAKHRISSLPVVDARDRICGVVSEADLIRDAFPSDPRAHLRHHEDAIHTQARLVSDVMTPQAVTVHQTTDVADLVELMNARGLKSLPVVDDQARVVGMVSRSDLVRVRARADDLVRHEVDLLLSSLGHRDWLVDVRDGLVAVEGPETSLDRSIAAVAAQTVAGVVGVAVR